MREMKDSGIEWMSAIPKDWNISRLKYVANFFNGDRGKNYPSGEDLVDDGIAFLTSNNIHEIVLDCAQEKSKFITEERYNRLGGVKIQLNDIVFCLRGSVGNCAINKTLAKGTVASSLMTIRPIKASPDFINYVLQTDVCGVQTIKAMNGSCAANLSAENVSNYYFAEPPVAEQEKIAGFLDSKCSEIDAISADIQKEIETLEQHKRSIITEAVTKGLKSDVEMKDSGIEWVGKIPANWTGSRLGYETYIRARLGWKGLKADEYVDEGYAFISAFNIQNNKLVWTPLNYITKERYDESPEIKLHIGDVIIVKDGAGIGKCARIDSLPMGETAPNSSIGVITPLAKLNYRYLAYYLQSAIFNNLILKLLNGMGVPHLTQEVMNKTPILMPPKQEQVGISDFLDAKCFEIDSAIEAKKKQIGILDTYKKSLIYEYVTGKKEVPSQN